MKDLPALKNHGVGQGPMSRKRIEIGGKIHSSSGDGKGCLLYTCEKERKDDFFPFLTSVLTPDCMKEMFRSLSPSRESSDRLTPD